MDRRGVAERAAYAVTCAVLMAWGLHWLWGPELPPGIDTTGHLTRLEVGLDLFASGHLDGWFDRAMLGYQTFLVYGPGLAFVVALVRVLSFGLLSIPGALEVASVVFLIAVAPAAAALSRAFGLDDRAARASGVLALVVSSPRGGGIQGAFDLGLLPNTVAAPLVLWGWALTLSRRPRPVLLAFVVVGIGITHPQSLVIFVVFLPFVLVAGRVAHVVDRSSLVTLGEAGALAAGLGAWWWVPAFVHRDLRGMITSWDLPTFVDHAELILDGERGWIGPAASLVVAVLAVGLVHGLWRRDTTELALVALPVAALALLHIAEWALVDTFYEVVLLPNRGLTYAAYLAVPAVGMGLSRLLGRLVPRWPAAPWIVAAVAVAVSMPSLRPPPWTFEDPSDGLRAAAVILADEVPDGSRFAFVYGPASGAGVPATGRWLGWTSGRNDLGPFGAEYAPGVGRTLVVFDPPVRSTVDSWIIDVQELGVTHIVTAEPDTTAVFAEAHVVDEVSTTGDVTVWVTTRPPPFELVAAERDAYAWDVDALDDRSLSLPVGWSPGWSVTVDGTDVATARSADGLLSIDVLAGQHRIDARFDLPSGYLVARSITALTVLGLVVSSWSRRRRAPDRRSRERPRPSRSA